jgi:NMD protein affecting ribosome stability and mRNA decay
MSNLYWLEPGWTNTTCPSCGKKIWPEGDPDWGMCYECFSASHEQYEPEPEIMCDICGKFPACAGENGYGVCSEYCAMVAADKAQREGEKPAS